MKLTAERIAAIDFERLAEKTMRFALGWHLAYLGVWALTSTWDYSWAGCFRCAHWIFGGALRAIGDSAAMGAVDALLARCAGNSILIYTTSGVKILFFFIF